MRRSEKNGERAEEVRGDKKRPAKVEPLRPQAEHTRKLPNDLAKFPEENPHPVLRIHKDGTVLYANKASEPLLKAKRSGVGLPAPSEWRRLAEAVLASGKMVREKVEYNRRIFEFLVVPIAETDYVDFYGDDITERKQAEQALRESETRFRTLADESFDSIVIHDGQRIIEVNKAFSRLWGYDPKEAVGMKIDKFFAPECWEDAKKRIRSGYDRPYEADTIRKDGTRFQVEIAGKSIIYKGKLARIATTRDITERKRAEEEILWKTALLESQVEANLDGVLVVDSNNQKILTNKRLIEMLKVPQHIVEDKDDTALLQYAVSQTKYPEQFLEKVEYLYSHQDETSQDEIEFKNGIVFDRYSSPVIDKNGKYFGRIWIFRDITDRKLAEESLRISETRFRELFNNMSSGVAVYEAVDDGSDFVFKDFNIAGQIMDKISREDVVGKRVTEIFPGVKAMGLLDILRRAWQTGRAEPYPTTLYKDSRISGWRENNVYKLPSGEIVAVYDDVTERKRVEEALKQSEEKFRALFEHMDSASCLDEVIYEDGKAVDYRILDINPSFERITGIGRAQAVGMLASQVYGLGAAPFLDIYAKVAETGEPNSFEAFFPPIGKHLHVTSFCPAKGRFSNMFIDITDSKRAEEKLLEYQRQLKQLASQLALTEERERRRIAGELHDQLCQSLALAKIKLDSLHASATLPPLAQALEDISGSIEKAIQDIRSLTFDLSSPILHELGFEAAVAEWLNEQLHDKGGIETEFQDDHLPKPLDDDVRVLLFRNVRELLINVIKHSRASKVKVCIRRTDDSIEITVRDNGVGFYPEEAKTMAAKTAKFGLFSIRESVEQLGGRFEIESKPDAGCKATIAAPLKGHTHKRGE